MRRWSSIRSLTGLIGLLVPMVASGQGSPPLISIQASAGSHYVFGCCDYHFWSSLNFTATGPATISMSSTSGAATASVSLHMAGDNVYQEIGGFDVYVRGIFRAPTKLRGLALLDGIRIH